MKTDKEAAEEYAKENWGKPEGSTIEIMQQSFEAGCKHKEESRWIPVSEDRDFSENERYVVLYSTTEMGGNRYHFSVGQFSKSRGKFSGEFDWTTAVYCMIIPTPPTNK